jgi:hypothetical protein
MKAMRMLVCTVGLVGALTGIARADDASMDPAAYKAKMHDCVTQMKSDHPDMNYKARRHACHKQLGPAPKAPAGSPPAATTPPNPTGN